MVKDKTLITKLIDGNVVIINKDDYDEVILPVEEMERLLDDTYMVSGIVVER